MRKCKKSKFKVGLQKRDRLFSPMIFVGHKQFISDTIIYLKISILMTFITVFIKLRVVKWIKIK